MSIGSLVEGHRLVVCVGPGGVGKTTLAAALAVGGALAGRRAVVLTIDPARALGRALGLDAISAAGAQIAPELFRAAGIEPRGTLEARMLDQKTGWDAFIERHAPSEETRRAILENPFYRELSSRFAGATEYVAVEELCRLHESGSYDLIVLDTPPAAHALDFVRAPEQIDRLLDPQISGWLTRPYASAGRAARSTVKFLLGRLARATGRKTFQDLETFFGSFETLVDGVRRRTVTSRALLHRPETAFVLVTGPDVLPATEALGAHMRALGVPIRGVIQNRVHPLPGRLDPSADADARTLLDALVALGQPEACAAWLARVYADALATARVEEQRSRQLEASLPADVERAQIAELEHDLCSLRDLSAVAADLWR